MVSDALRIKQNLGILKDWLYNQYITVCNPFTNQQECVRHIKLSDDIDDIDDIIVMFLGDSKSYVELMCTGITNIYTFNDFWVIYCNLVCLIFSACYSYS